MAKPYSTVSVETTFRKEMPEGMRAKITVEVPENATETEIAAALSLAAMGLLRPEAGREYVE